MTTNQGDLSNGIQQNQHLLGLRQRVPGAKALHLLALEGPQPALPPGNHIAVLFAARRAQVLGAFVPLRQAQGRLLALDEPQAQPLKVAGGELVEGQGVGCAGDEGWDWVIGVLLLPQLLTRQCIAWLQTRQE